MLIVSVAVAAALLTVSFLAFRSYYALSDATDTFINMHSVADSLMTASDYLTEEVQCYTVLGDRKHLENYFIESEQTRRRENAVAAMERDLPDTAALEELKTAMEESLSLMDREYYAMVLILSAQGDPDVPPALSGVTLSDADAALSAEEKQALAIRLTHDDEYYLQKSRVRENLSRCIEELVIATEDTETRMEHDMRRDLRMMVVFIVLQSLGMVLILALTTRLGIRPILRAVERIKHDQDLPIMGAHEFRYLAQTYNKMYRSYKRSLSNLSFKASHDALTGIYNRSGFDLIMQSIDYSSTALLMIDADNFKSINDEFGHEAGDLTLKNITSIMKGNFRSDDYICRLGGDEFVVLMIHVRPKNRAMIARKVDTINNQLSLIRGDIPPTSVSVGVTFCSEDKDVQTTLREADAALYRVKQSGRHGCCFYKPGMEQS